MLDLLEREHDNLRAALDWLAEQRDVEGSLRLALALSEFWLIRGYYVEGQARLSAVLALPGAEQPSTGRAMALRRTRRTRLEVGDPGGGAAAPRGRARRGAGHRGPARHSTHALPSHAADRGGGKRTEARALGEQSLAMLRALDDRVGSHPPSCVSARIINRDGEPQGAASSSKRPPACFERRTREDARPGTVLRWLCGPSTKGDHAEARRQFATASRAQPGPRPGRNRWSGKIAPEADRRRRPGRARRSNSGGPKPCGETIGVPLQVESRLRPRPASHPGDGVSLDDEGLPLGLASRPRPASRSIANLPPSNPWPPGRQLIPRGTPHYLLVAACVRPLWILGLGLVILGCPRRWQFHDWRHRSTRARMVAAWRDS